MGKPYREANWEGGASAGAFSYYAELARHDQGRVSGPAIAGQWQMKGNKLELVITANKPHPNIPVGGKTQLLS